MPPRPFLCQLVFAAVFSVSFINLSLSAPSFLTRRTRHATLPSNDNNNVFCPQSELADDVLVVLRTGATESRQKVPVHFRTTLRCVPHFLLLSDFNEEIDGHAVHDVLDGVSELTRKTHSDFNLYYHLQKHGRLGLQEQDAVTANSGSFKGDYLNTERSGWSLDKWKFLPMIDRAYQEMPNAKWFVFIEADTYLNWNNLLEYLANFDASKSYYVGKHLYINDVEFGYGGAGVVLSNPAMRKVHEHRSVRIRDYEDFTASHWVGDCALGKILEDVKIPLHRGYPHLTADSPATMDPATVKIDRDAWCYPVITYHHVSAQEIEELWNFEQHWYKRHDVLLRHRDVFMEQVRSKIRTALPEWDNMSTDKEYNAHDHSTLADETERNAWKSFRHCHAVCEQKKDCVQFSYESGSCSLSYSFRLGYAKPKERVQAGWMLDRVDDIFLKLETRCGVRDWFSPQGGSITHKKRK